MEAISNEKIGRDENENENENERIERIAGGDGDQASGR